MAQPSGAVLQRPADSPCLLHLAMGAALCNDSSLRYRPDKGGLPDECDVVDDGFV